MARVGFLDRNGPSPTTMFACISKQPRWNSKEDHEADIRASITVFVIVFTKPMSCSLF
jgi:hypothetical protein